MALNNQIPKLCYHPGWRLMRIGYRTCFHTLYDEKKMYKQDLALNNQQWLISYLPTPSLGQDMTQGQFFKRSLTGLNSVFLLLD